MDGKEKLYFLLDAIEDARTIAPSGQPLVIDPTNDLNQNYREVELSQLFTKLEKDEQVLKVLKVPGRIKTIDFVEGIIPDEPIPENDDGCWHIKLLPAFDGYYLKIQYEPEYQEFTGKKPPTPSRNKLSRKSLEKIWGVLQEIEDKRGITSAQDDISIPLVHFSKVKDDIGANNASDERRNILRKLENEENAIKDVRLPDNLREYVYLKIGERYFEVFDYYEKEYKEAARNYQQTQQIPKQTNSLEKQYKQLLKEVKEPSKPTIAERYDETLKDIQLNQHPTKPQTVPKINDSNSYSLTENVLSVNGKPIKFKRDARITDDNYDRFYQPLRDQISDYDTRLALLQEAEDNYYITAKYLLELANRAYDLFVSSEVTERRQLIKLVLQNLRVEGKTVRYDALKPFDEILNCSDRQLWLPRVDSNHQPAD